VANGETGSITETTVGRGTDVDVGIDVQVGASKIDSGSAGDVFAARDASTNHKEAMTTIPTPRMSQKGGRFLRSI
jgi:hypothetical protein